GHTKEVKKNFPDVHVYQDWRELLDKEKNLNSVNVSTPDHMHGSITMRAMQQGLNVYTQKPLTQTIFEARQLTRVAKEKKIISQMGIQIHSHEVHRAVVSMIHGGAIGKVKEVHSWSGKHWGDRKPRPDRKDSIPDALNWDFWLGVAAERPFISGYYHPGEWRKRLDFGTGTFGDMGCHILDGVLYSPYIDTPRLFPQEKFKEYPIPKPGHEDHYRQFVEAVRGNGTTSTPFSYSGPLTETVLLGTLATRFPQTTLEWDAEMMK